MSYLGNRLIEEIVELIAGKLPAGWRVASSKASSRAEGGVTGAVLKIRRTRTAVGSVRVEARTRLEPKDVDYMAVSLRPTPDQPVLIAAPFISPRTRERLSQSRFAYADLTGNIRLSLVEPGLFIEMSGASDNPDPNPRDRKSLKGAKAGRLVRALCDFRPPIGLRDLAKRAGVDPGYASRIVTLLDREALLARSMRGPIATVDWAALLRRWSQEYSPYQRRRVTMYLAPRGITSVIEKLKNVSTRFAISGSWAATQFASVAPPRLVLVYADRPAQLANELDLRPTDAGANVAVAMPFNEVVYERTTQKGGVTIAALSQVAADLLTSPGRGPNEAEALMEWMRDHEGVWRA